MTRHDTIQAYYCTIYFKQEPVTDIFVLNKNLFYIILNCCVTKTNR